MVGLANATSQDKTLELMKQYIMKGWLNKVSVAEIFPYFQKCSKVPVMVQSFRTRVLPLHLNYYKSVW